MSSRSGLPRMWFSARAVSVNGKSSALRRFGRGGNALGRVLERVDPVLGVVVLDRAADRAGLGGGVIAGRRPPASGP